MECLIGIKGKDFVILASDGLAARSIVAMKKDQEKMFKLSNNLLMSVCGGDGDTTQFAEYISKNIQLYRMRNGYDLSTQAAASFTRRNIADSLRSRNAHQVNLLMAGCDKRDGASLFYMDYLGALVKVPFAAHGYSSFFSLSVMDRYYKEDMKVEEAMQLLNMCIDEIRSRLIINLSVFKVKRVDKDGVHDLPDIFASPAPERMES